MHNKVFSFFAGSGFMDLGFEEAGVEIVFVNEYFKPFMDAYQYSREILGTSEPQFGYSIENIEAFTSGKQRKQLGDDVSLSRHDGSLVGFIGGPPCPDFSVGGKNRGRMGENGKLSRIYVDMIIQQKPDWFLFENVKGLFRTSKHREFFDELVADLRKAGYALNYDILNSIEFGVPQDRDRIILVGVQKGLISDDLQSFPEDEIYKRHSDMSSLNLRSRAIYKERDAFKYDWPKTNSFSKDKTLSQPNNIPLKLTIEHWFRKNNTENHSNSQHHFQPRAGLEKFKKVFEGDVSKKSYKRPHRWRYSPTAAYGNNEVHLHPYKPRRLSAAEALAIQSMPKEFCLPSHMSLSNMFKTIGNGVPYLLAYNVAATIQSYLEQVVCSEDTYREAVSST
jgi:DNA (cytosine-5)-methyltransferase 1